MHSWQLRCEAEGVDALSRCEAEQEHRLMHQAGTGSNQSGIAIVKIETEQTKPTMMCWRAKVATALQPGAMSAQCSDKKRILFQGARDEGHFHAAKVGTSLEILIMVLPPWQVCGIAGVSQRLRCYGLKGLNVKSIFARLDLQTGWSPGPFCRRGLQIESSWDRDAAKCQKHLEAT